MGGPPEGEPAVGSCHGVQTPTDHPTAVGPQEAPTAAQGRTSRVHRPQGGGGRTPRDHRRSGRDSTELRPQTWVFGQGGGMYLLLRGPALRTLACEPPPLAMSRNRRLPAGAVWPSSDNQLEQCTQACGGATRVAAVGGGQQPRLLRHALKMRWKSPSVKSCCCFCTVCTP